MDVWPALKEMVYSFIVHAHLIPEKMKKNIKWLIGKKEAECIQLDISDYNGITEIDFEGFLDMAFYPDKVRGEGFFMSAIRKTNQHEKAQSKSHKKPNSRRIKLMLKSQIDGLIFIQQNYKMGRWTFRCSV